MAASQGSMTSLRRPPTLPGGIEPPDVDVSILHPGYKDSEENSLMILPCLDQKADIFGVHFGTVATLCAIFSGRSDGFFTKERRGQPLQLQFDELLDNGTYYYHIPGVLQYPVFASFDHWEFPHYTLPAGYDRQAENPSIDSRLSSITTVAASITVIQRDKSCALSRDADILEKAHLSPKHKTDWFQKNTMKKYNQYSSTIPIYFTEDPANAIALRSDIHKGFDKQWFAIVRKEDAWMAHFVRRTVTMSGRYHNMDVHIDDEVSTQFIYARLAWTAFSLLLPFLQSIYKRYLFVRVQGDNGAYETKTEYWNLLDCQPSAAPSREGNESPSKKQRTSPSKSSAKSGRGARADTEEDGNRGRGRRRVADIEHVLATDALSMKDREHDLFDTELPPSFITTSSEPCAVTSQFLPSEAPNNPYTPPFTPDSTTFSDDASLSNSRDAIESYLGSIENGVIEALRAKELRRRRPLYDPERCCCDYTAYEKEQEKVRRGEIEVGECVVGMCVDCDGWEIE